MRKAFRFLMLSFLMVPTFMPVTAFPASGTVGAAQTCAIDLCGRAQDQLKLAAEGDFGKLESEQTKSFFRQTVSPHLQKNLQASKSLAATVDALKRVTLRPKQRGFVLTLSLYKLLLARKAELGLKSVTLNSKDGKRVVDPAQLPRVFPGWNPSRQAAVERLLNAFFATSYFVDSFSWKDGSLDDYLAATSEAEAQKSRFYIDATLTYAWEMFGSEIFWRIDGGLVDRMVGRETLTTQEKNLIFETFLTGMTFLAAVQEPVLTAASSVDVAPAEVLTLLEKSVGHIGAGELTSFCEHRVNQNLAAAPSELRLRKMEDVFAQIKLAVRTVTPRYLTGAALTKALAQIENLRVGQPPTMAEVRQTLAATFASQTDALNRASAMSGKVSSENSPYFAMSLLYEEVGLDEGRAAVKRACESLTPKYFVDRAYADTNRITLGWQSAVFTDFGAGVIAHELGHIVSAQARAAGEGAKAFSQTRDCNLGLHGALHATPGAAEATSEEDWADTFAMSVLKELRRTWPYAQNFGCVLLTTDPKGRYLEVDRWDTSSEAATHSPDLLRALLIHQGIGHPLPRSCETLIRSKTPTLPLCAR